MIKSVCQIDWKITACCLFLQPIKNRLVPNVLAAGAIWKIALLEFFYKDDLCNSNCSSSPTAFIFFLFFLSTAHIPWEKVSFKKIIMFQIINF